MTNNVHTATDRLNERCEAIDFETMTPLDYGLFVDGLPADEFSALLAMHDEYRRPGGAEVEGLPVPGYRAQTPEAIASVSAVKEVEEHVLRLLDELKDDPDLKVDQRWLATGRTDIEKGFMAVNRSVFKPGRLDIDPKSAEPEIGWLLERADSPASQPLYYYPRSHGTQWIGDANGALRLSRQADGDLLAKALGVEVRVAEHHWG